MEVATIISMDGAVNMALDGRSETLQQGDAVMLNSLISTQDASECTLQLLDGSSIHIDGNQSLLLDSDVVSLPLDSTTEAVASDHSFLHAVVQLALHSTDASPVGKILSGLNELLFDNQTASIHDGNSLLDSQDLMLMEAETSNFGYDLLSGNPIDQESGSPVSLEEALIGDAVPMAELSHSEQVSGSMHETIHASDLPHILENALSTVQVEALVQNLVQSIDLSSHFATTTHTDSHRGLLELGALDDDENFTDLSFSHQI